MSKKTLTLLLACLALTLTNTQANASLTVGNLYGSITVDGDDDANSVAFTISDNGKDLTITDLSGQAIEFGSTTSFSLEKLCPKKLASNNGATVVCKSIEDSADTYRIFDNDIQVSLGSGDDKMSVTGTAYNSGFTVFSGKGDDSVQTSSGPDEIVDPSGTDSFDAGDGEDSISCTESSEPMLASLLTKTCSSYSETDRILNFENLKGDSGDDYLEGDDQANYLSGDSGNNTIIGYGGNDTITTELNRGGVSYNDTVDSGDGDDTVNTYYGDDRIASGSGNDTVDSGDGDDTITDTSGNDQLYGGAGSDVITDPAGDDTLMGAGGLDNLNGYTDPSISTTSIRNLKLKEVLRKGRLDIKFTCNECAGGWNIKPPEEASLYVYNRKHEATFYAKARVIPPSGSESSYTLRLTLRTKTKAKKWLHRKNIRGSIENPLVNPVTPDGRGFTGEQDLLEKITNSLK